MISGAKLGEAAGGPKIRILEFLSMISSIWRHGRAGQGLPANHCVDASRTRDHGWHPKYTAARADSKPEK
jgi:hypothetical protein